MVWGVKNHRNKKQGIYLGSMKPFSEGEPGSLALVVMMIFVLVHHVDDDVV